MLVKAIQATEKGITNNPWLVNVTILLVSTITNLRSAGWFRIVLCCLIEIDSWFQSQTAVEKVSRRLKAVIRWIVIIYNGIRRSLGFGNKMLRHLC